MIETKGGEKRGRGSMREERKGQYKRGEEKGDGK